jgi:DNA polymerase-3 subunit alpha
MRVANKTTIEALVRAGACDSLGGHRAQLVAALDSALRAAASEQADRRAGQMNLLGEIAGNAPAPPLPNVEPWSETEQARPERETTGRCWTSNPLAGSEDLIAALSTHSTADLAGCPGRTPVVIGGLLLDLQERVIRSGRNEGKRMARFRLEDAHGSVEAILFSEAYARCRAILAANEVFFFVGDIDDSRAAVTLRVTAVHTPAQAPGRLGEVELRLSAGTDVDAVRATIARHEGSRPVRLRLRPEPGLTVVVRPDDGVQVDPTPALRAELEALLGPDCVVHRPKAPEVAAPRRGTRRPDAP